MNLKNIEQSEKMVHETEELAEKKIASLEAENEHLKKEIDRISEYPEAQAEMILKKEADLQAAREALRIVHASKSTMNLAFKRQFLTEAEERIIDAALTTPQSPESAAKNWPTLNKFAKESEDKIGDANVVAEPAAPKCEHDKKSHWETKPDTAGEFSMFGKINYSTCPFCPAPSTEPATKTCSGCGRTISVDAPECKQPAGLRNLAHIPMSAIEALKRADSLLGKCARISSEEDADALDLEIRVCRKMIEETLRLSEQEPA